MIQDTMSDQPCYVLISPRSGWNGWRVMIMNRSHLPIETVSEHFSEWEAYDEATDEGIRLGIPVFQYARQNISPLSR